MTTPLTATISGAFLRPDDGKASMSAYIEAASAASLLTYAGGVIASKTPVKLQSDGSASVTIWQLPQAGIDPTDARWRLVMESGQNQYVKEFNLTADMTWDDIVDVSGVPITPSLIEEAEQARDAALAAVAAVKTGTWQATTAYVSGQTVQAPDGSLIKSSSSRTSRASFDATEQTFWTVVFASSGTLDQLAFDARQDARSRSKYAPAPSGDTTGVADTANLVAALAAMSKTSGLTTPTTDPIVMELGAGPYYINPNAITIGPGQAVRSKARLGTVINCVGGTVGQAFITTVDTGFTLTGGQLTSHGGEVSGIILDGTNAGRGTIGVLRGSLINAKLDVMLRHFGANTSASSAATTTTVNGRSDTTVVTNDSSIITDVSVVIADLGTAVTGTGIPAGSVVTSLVKGVKFNLGRQAPSPANATASGSITLQVGWFRNDTVTLTSGSNFVPDASAVAGDLNAPVFGTNVPKDAIVMAVDPGVGLYLGIPARAILYQNQGSGWFERSDDRIEIFNCAMGVVFDGAVTSNSYSYNKLHLTCDMRHDQKLIHVRGNPAMFGQDWTVYGTFTSYGANNNGVGLMQSGSSGWRGRMEWHLESANHGTQQAVPHFMADSPSTFYGVGSFEFYANPGFPAWQSSKRQVADLNANSPSAIGFKGMVGGVWGITDIVGFGAGAARTIGAETKSNGLTALATTTYSIFLESGSIFAVTLAAATTYTVAFNAVSFLGSQQGFDITFIVTQVGAGTASTIGTWPASIKWTSGTAPPVNPALGSVTMYRLISRDGGATWTGAAL